jgi:hypothetical protein
MVASAAALNIQQPSNATIIMITSQKNGTGARNAPLPIQGALVFGREPRVWRDTIKDRRNTASVYVDHSNLRRMGSTAAVQNQEARETNAIQTKRLRLGEAFIIVHLIG